MQMLAIILAGYKFQRSHIIIQQSGRATSHPELSAQTVREDENK